MLLYILVVLISYLIGSVSTSYIISKKVFDVDIRTKGSKNAGATNVLRTLGAKAGLLTFVGDFLKGTVAVLIAMLIAKYSNHDLVLAKYISAVAVVCGHNWPIFLKFKGGKGVSTTYGAMAAISPISTIACAIFFIIIAIVTGYVSVASMLSVALFPVLMYISGDPSGVWMTIILLALVVYRHRANIKKLIAGEERRTDLFGKIFGKK